MERSSAGSIASLFENYPNFPRKKTKPGAFLVNTVFPRGHVREHDAIHYLDRCSGITQMRGQNGFARDYEYLQGHLEKLYAQGQWLIKENRKKFDRFFLQELSKKIGNDAAAHIAYVEQSVLLLEEEEIGEQFVEDFSILLHSVADLSTSMLFEKNIVKPALELARKHFFAPVSESETGYFVNGIPYTLPRYFTNYNGLTIVCQPDGLCLANGLTTVVEIKSPIAGHYTSELQEAEHGVKGRTTEKKAENRQKLWTKYLVQIAIEMDVTNARKAIFLSWFEHSGKLILLTRDIMQPLIDAVKVLAGDLSLEKQGEPANNIIDALNKITGQETSRLTISQMQKELTTLGCKHVNLGRNKKPYVEKLTEMRAASPQSNNSYTVVNAELANILKMLTLNGDAWQPLNDTFEEHGLDLLASSLNHVQLDLAMEKTVFSGNIAAFRTYIKN
mgnify:CR=1 FL=1